MDPYLDYLKGRHPVVYHRSPQMRITLRAISFIIAICRVNNLPSPLDSIREAVLTVSPNRQYRGILRPTTPATHEPEDWTLANMNV